MKRSKRSPSDFGEELNTFNERHETNSDRYIMNQQVDASLHRNVSFQQQNSFEEGRHMPAYKGSSTFDQDEFDVDSLLLTREERAKGFNRYGFFGLAVIFGAVGILSSFDGRTLSDSITNSHSVHYFGMHKREGGVSTQPSCSITDPNCDANLSDVSDSVDSASFFSNLTQGFIQVVETLSGITNLNYFSYILSAVFLLLWVKTFFDGESPAQAARPLSQKPVSGSKVQ